MSGIELVGFILGLDPLLTHGQHLVTRCRAYRSNRDILKERTSFTAFHAHLSTASAELERKSDHLSASSRDIVATDARKLLGLLKRAIQHASKINHYSANRVTQFLRANALADELASLFEVLETAESILQHARKFMEIMQSFRNMSPKDSIPDQFRSYFPAMTNDSSVVLEFDALDSDGDPATVEARIKKLITMEQPRKPRIVAIHGPAGVGKSTILAGLVREGLVRETFPDGVHVIKLGMNATRATLIQQIRKTLSDSGAAGKLESLNMSDNLDEAIDLAISWFGGKRCGFFVDDVWSWKVGVGPIAKLCELADGANKSAVIITSREEEVAAIAHHECVISVKRRDRHGTHSRRILFTNAETEVSKTHDEIEESLKQVLSVCDGLPVLLAAAGKSVKKMRRIIACQDQIVWKRYASKLQECRESLIVEPVPGYGNLMATLTTSLAFLEDERNKMDYRTNLTFSEMYRRLCVLEKQARVPLTMLKHLWEVESEARAEMIAMEYAEMGLGHVEGKNIAGEWVWRMGIHDSLHDFSVMEAKRCSEVKSIHEGLVRRYSGSGAGLSGDNGGTQWWSKELSPDGYIHENLCRHLYEAGLVSELVELVLSPEWTGRKLEVNDVSSVEDDLTLCLEAIRKKSVAGKASIGEGIEMILAAIRLSSGFIAKDKRELWFQLHGRLHTGAESKQEVKKYLGRAIRYAPLPRLESLNSFLVPCGGPTTRIFSLDAYPTCLKAMTEKRIACGCGDGSVDVLDLMDGRVTTTWRAHNQAISAITIWDDLLVTTSQDSTAKLWNAETGVCVQTITTNSSWIISVAITADGCLVTGSFDGSVRVWGRDCQLSKGPYETGAPVWCVSSLPDGRIVSAGSDKVVRIWDSSGEAVELAGHEDWVRCLAVTHDGNIISGSNDHTVRTWNPLSLEQIAELRHTNFVSSVAAHDKLIVSGTHDCTICKWDTSGVATEVGRHSDWVNGLCIVGESVVSSSLDGTVRVWDVNSGASQEPDGHTRPVETISFFPDGRAITGSSDDTMRVWNRAGQTLATLRGHNGAVMGVTVCTDGRIASLSRDKTLRIWDSETFELVKVFRGHEGWIMNVDSMDDGRVVTGSRDGTLRLWNIDNGECTTVPGGDAIIKVFAKSETVISVTLPGMITMYRCEQDGGITTLKTAEYEDAWKLGRREVMVLLGEPTEGFDAVIVRGSREIRYKGLVLGSLESAVRAWDLWQDVMGLGLTNGCVAFLKVFDNEG